MGTHIIDAFLVTFGLDDSDFKRGEREVEQATKKLRDGNKRTFDEMEQRGAKAAETFKKVRNEVVGLGLAFMGASSITGMISSMLTGAAAADRIGKNIGMATKSVWAWRMATKSQGGQAQDGDAALQTVQNARMGWQMSGSTGNDAAYWRLGINGNDLKTKDAGEILQKIAGMQSKLDPQVYASLLQQIGLPSSMIAFLQQGKTSVDKLIKQFEGDAKGQEKLAKESEKLQETLAKLQATVAEKLVPAVETIANFLNRVLGGGGAPSGRKGGVVYEDKVFGGMFSIHEGAASAGGGKAPTVPVKMGGAAPYAAALIAAGMSPTLAAGFLGNMQMESGFDGRRVGDGGKARGVMQWHPDRQANFRRLFGTDVANATPAQVAQFIKWEMDHSVSQRGRLAIMQAAASGSAAATARMIDQHYERSAGLTRTQRGAAADVYASRLGDTHNYNIRSTDPHAVASEIHRIQKSNRRHAVAQADRGVAS